MITTTINTNNIIENYSDQIKRGMPHCLTATHLAMGKKYQGKVRDTYDLGDKLILITTDRQSAFDRVLASVPYKGQVLNLTSAWWFEQTQDIIPNHVIVIPDPNVTIAKKCKVFPIEFVVRGYITGTTNTSLWTQYQKGVRNYCGNVLPEGLAKNQRLEKPMMTPTTKDDKHDRPISPEEIIREGWMTQED
jgi:phosphoribosylaminoimidazole-succinocarboxamide synthase